MGRPVKFTREVFEAAYKQSNSMYELAQRLNCSINTPYRLAKMYALPSLGGTSHISSFRMDASKVAPGANPRAHRYNAQVRVEGHLAPEEFQLCNKDPVRFFQLIELMRLFTGNRRLVEVARMAHEMNPPITSVHTYMWALVDKNLGATWDYYEQVCLDLNAIFEPNEAGDPPKLPPPDGSLEMRLYNCFAADERFASQSPDGAVAAEYEQYIDSYINLWNSPEALAEITHTTKERVAQWQQKVTQYVDNGPNDLDPFTPASAKAEGAPNGEEEK